MEKRIKKESSCSSPSFASATFAGTTNRIESILLNNSLEFGGNNILNSLTFSQRVEKIPISFGFQTDSLGYSPVKEYVAGPIRYESVEVEMNPDDKILAELFKLFDEQKHINFLVSYKNGRMVMATGRLMEIFSYEDKIGFKFQPDIFEMI